MLAPVLTLRATTGLRLRALSGLRRDRVHLVRNEHVIDYAKNGAGGVVVEKQTKTRSRRVVSLDDATAEHLRLHLIEMDNRAAPYRVTIPPDGVEGSLAASCAESCQVFGSRTH